MEQSSSWEDSQFSASQEIPHILWNRKFITTFTSHLSMSWARSSHFLKIHLNIIFPSIPGFSKWSVSLRFHHQNPVCSSPIPNICYMNRQSHSSRFDHSKITWWEVQFTLPSLYSFSPLPCYLVPPSMWATNFHTHTKPRAKLYFCISLPE